MSALLVIKWILFALALAGAMRGLHHLCLWLEERGLLYYKHKQPNSSPMGCLVGLQKAIAPSIEHVIHAKEAKRRHSEESGDGMKLETAPDAAPASGA
jgi:hypothetical protein